MPASVAAYIISARASSSLASRTARTWNSLTSLSACVASRSENGFAPCDTGRPTPFAGLSRRGHARAVSASSAWLMQSKPVEATMAAGSERVTSGSISATVGVSRREMMPVFALSAVSLKIEMPVVSEPVPEVVGQAMCGFSAPGHALPRADRRVHVGHELGRVRRVQVRGLAGVHHRAAADGDVPVEAALGGEAGRVLEGEVRGLDLDLVVDRDVHAGLRQRGLHLGDQRARPRGRGR